MSFNPLKDAQGRDLDGATCKILFPSPKSFFKIMRATLVIWWLYVANLAREHPVALCD